MYTRDTDLSRMNNAARSRRVRDNERGSILVLAVILSMIVLGMGVTANYLASSETRITNTVVRGEEANYAALTGLAHARSILKNNASGWAGILDGTACSTPQTEHAEKGFPICDPATGDALINTAVVGSNTTTVRKNWTEPSQH